MADREAENREGLRKIRLDPVGECRHVLPVANDDILVRPLCLGRVIDVEVAAEVRRVLCLHGHLRHVAQRVMHDVRLAALPRHAGQRGFHGGAEDGVAVAFSPAMPRVRGDLRNCQRWISASPAATPQPKIDRLQSGRLSIAVRRAQNTMGPSSARSQGGTRD